MTLRVYLVQHGEAVAKAVDPERPLTEEGLADVQRVASFLATCGIRVHRVLHSGKMRAAQTAHVLSQGLAPGVEPEAFDGLNPTDSGERLAKEIRRVKGDLLVAGHQPFMGRLASSLLTGADSTLTLDYRPGSVACLQREDDGSWSLQWMVRPELFPA